MKKVTIRAASIIMALALILATAACGAPATPAATTAAATTAAAETTAAATTAAETTAAAAETTAAAATTAQAATTAAATTASSAPILPAATESDGSGLPIVSEPLTLSMWCTLSKSAVSLSTFDDMLAYQELQKRTGITIEFLHPPVGGETENFNLMVASRELPDLIEHSWRGVQGGPGAYIRDGVIIALNDYIDEYAPNLLQTYADIPVARKESIMDDGTHYMFPCLYVSPELQHATGPVLRADWLAQIGAEEPVTIDEWHDLLLEVKNSSLDGNDDVIPFTMTSGQFNDSHIFVGAWGISTRFTQNDGQIVFGPLEPQFRDFVVTMADWYAKGLIDEEYAANTGKELDDKVMGNKAFAFMGSMGNEITRYTGTMRPTNPDFTLMAQYYPVLERGIAPIICNKSDTATGGGMAITTACKNVVEAVKLMDYNYSWDGMLLGNFGIEGVTYNLVDGEPVYTDLILKNPDGLDIASAISKHCYHSGNTALPKPNWVTNQRDSLPEQLEGRKRWMETTNAIRQPPLLPTLEESNEYSSLMTTINSYIDESLTNFIMGRTPLSEYESFVNTLSGMGVSRAMEIRQAQMDRYINR